MKSLADVLKYEKEILPQIFRDERKYIDKELNKLWSKKKLTPGQKDAFRVWFEGYTWGRNSCCIKGEFKYRTCMNEQEKECDYIVIGDDYDKFFKELPENMRWLPLYEEEGKQLVSERRKLFTSVNKISEEIAVKFFTKDRKRSKGGLKNTLKGIAKIRFAHGKLSSEQKRYNDNKALKLYNCLETFDKEIKTFDQPNILRTFIRCFFKVCMEDRRDKVFSATTSWFERGLSICRKLDDYNTKIIEVGGDEPKDARTYRIKLWKKLMSPGVRAGLSLTGNAAINDDMIRTQLRILRDAYG